MEGGSSGAKGVPAVLVDRLIKRYGRLTAVDDLSFEVERGEIFALLGPNGAGKTTTIEILEGYKRRDAGRVRVLGLDPGKEARALRGRIGLMLQEGGLYPGIKVREAAALFCSYYERSEPPSRLLEIAGLTGDAAKQVRHLSGGTKQRLSLALALAGKPELLFLDEPTSGLDPRARADAWALLSELKSSGVTMIITTHLLDEAERLADRVGIIDRGKMVALGTPAGLGAKEVVEFTAERELSAEELSELREALGAEVSRLRRSRYRARLAATPEALARLASWMAERKILLVHITAGAGSLEEVFLEVTEGP